MRASSGMSFSLYIHNPLECQNPQCGGYRSLNSAYASKETANGIKHLPTAQWDTLSNSSCFKPHKRFATPQPIDLTALKRDPSQHWLNVKDTAEYIPSLFPWVPFYTKDASRKGSHQLKHALLLLLSECLFPLPKFLC